jgi:hypothetical protein
MKKWLLALVALLLATAPTLAQTTTQFPTAPWAGYAPAQVLCGRLIGANFNSTSDQPIIVTTPSPNYAVEFIWVSNPSTSLTTAAGGIYSAASKGGVAVVASSQAYSVLTSNTANTSGNGLLLTLSTAGGNQTVFTQNTTLYLSLTTPQGAAATADVRVFCDTLY